MKNILIVLVFASAVLSACGGHREETDDKDSINAAKAADSMLQNQLNSDTSMNTDSTIDNKPTDSMSQGTAKKP